MLLIYDVGYCLQIVQEKLKKQVLELAPARGVALMARGAMFCRIGAPAPGFCAGRSKT
ncbi:hypothetical protein A2U01_0108464, partial [Trifolium medium]|nr:hypothetical protein [Trifolium medium]